MLKSNSHFLHHSPCPKCGSKNNLAVYSDGSFCFTPGCGYQGEEFMEKELDEKFYDGEIKALNKRHITAESCDKFGYKVGKENGKSFQIANYYLNNKVVAQKLRYPNKQFKFIGDTDSCLLYGEWLWRQGGKMITVVEGELDCISLSQCFNHKYSVVSVRSASSAKNDIRKSLEFLNSYETVVFLFDMDEAGQQAAQDCAQLIAPGKAKIARISEKDPNDMLVKGKVKELLDSIWEAKTFRPDGIVDGRDLWDVISKKELVYTSNYPYKSLNEKTKGLRCGELVTICAGSGIGKSSFVREIGHSLIKGGESVGFIMLEESIKRTALGLIGIEVERPLHLECNNVVFDDLVEPYNRTVGSGRVYLYDSFGATEFDNLQSRIRYFAQSCGCKFIILDHLHIALSTNLQTDERRMIDNFVTNLRTLVQELNIGLLCVSHLNRPKSDTSFEEGKNISLTNLRGSHSIAQLSDMVLSLERNQQADDPNRTTIRVLKNRFTGETGTCGQLIYNPETGRLLEDANDDY